MDTPRLNVLSVCSGIGGLDLGIKQALPQARTVCYVEREAFCCEHLAEAMEEAQLDKAPLWTDITTFDGTAWRGRVDLIFGGIPCQPHSVAGKQLRGTDERDLIDEFLRITREVGPSYVIVENVRGFLSPDGVGRLTGGLAELLFDTEGSTLQAFSVGTPQRRERLFILAYSKNNHRRGRERGAKAGAGTQEGGRWRSTSSCEGVVDHAWPPRLDDVAGWQEYLKRHPGSEPEIRRGTHGLPNRVDRLRALGNAVVPAQAAAAITGLLRRFET